MRRHVPFFPPMSRKDSLWLNLLGLPVLGVILVTLATLGLFDLQTRIAYETDARTAPGTVVEIVAGSPVVEFVPEENGLVPVITSARGTFERGAETDVEVTYLAGDPSEVALGNGMWIPPLLWGAIALAVAIAVMLLHPDGPRVVLYRLRRKAYRTGSTAMGEAARRAVRWRRWLGSGLLAASLTLLAVSGTVLLAAPGPEWPTGRDTRYGWARPSTSSGRSGTRAVFAWYCPTSPGAPVRSVRGRRPGPSRRCP